VYFIAEAGSNHNGNLEVAKRLASVAAEAGADAVKFQTFVPEELISAQSDDIDALRELILEEEEMRLLQEHTENLGISFLSTPFDEESVTTLDNLDVDAFKIGSGDLVNHPLLEHAASFSRPLIVSTGMANKGEIRAAENHIKSINPDLNVAFLHCISAYPTEIVDLNLRMMSDIDELVDGPVGFSDHSRAVETPGLAVASGASIVEKHFTLSRHLPVPDAEVSLEPDELAQAVDIARNAANALGSSKKHPIEAERPNKNEFRKSVHTTTDIPRNTMINEDDLKLIRPADGLKPTELDAVIGTKTRSNLSAGDPITWADLYIKE